MITAVNTQARRRWMLFYTLLKNPHLILLRKHHLSSGPSQEAPSSRHSDAVLHTWVMVSQAQSQQMTLQSPLEVEVIPAEDC